MEKLQLYYHFPFCQSKCVYCAFFSKANQSEELIDAYTNALITQTNNFAFPNSYEVSSIYFGGGTPTVAGVKRLIKVLEAVKSKFILTDDCEITLEINPKTVDLVGLTELKCAGFNRLSMGAQSFNDETLALLKRSHNANDFVCCYAAARKAGFSNINVDLIFALPNETISMLSNSLEKLVHLSPEHVSVYSLSVEQGTALYEQKESLSFPSEEEEERQYELVCNVLANNGYLHYEISNYAKSGCFSRHNTGYWQRVQYFGFGAGAHSFFKNRRFFTADCIELYIVNSGKDFLYPTSFYSSAEISDSEAEEERIMLGLRLSSGVRIDKPIPQYLFRQKLVKYINGYLSLTEKGYRVSNAIIQLFI